MRALFGLAVALLFAAAPATAAMLTGINLAGGEFGGPAAVYGKGYHYPDAAQMQLFRARGMNVFRIPVRWERLQPALGGALDPTEMARVDAVIADATGMGASVILDIHNYGRYARQPIISAAVPADALPNLWRRLAQRYRGNPRVIFGLMNEPVRIGAGDWARIAGATVVAIRQTGARNLVLVPGAYWSGAHSWVRAMAKNPSNATALTGFRDPANNFAFDLHQYFDPNSSGTTPACVAPETAVARLAVATAWLRSTGSRGMLTEFGVSQDPTCAAVLTAALNHLADNREWIGWTLWASSPWFGRYPFNLYPLQSPPPPQLDVLTPFLAAPPSR